MQYIALLGRQPQLGLAELEAVFSAGALTPFSSSACLVETTDFDVQRFGGIVKAGRVISHFDRADWPTMSKKLVQHYAKAWATLDHKQTLGISLYEWDVSPRQVQKLGLELKSALKRSGVSLRLIPNQDAALSSATSHHNKLGLSANKTELLIVRHGQRIVVAESVGAQNISALAARDQGRPKRDAFVGMLPPKLALMMINLGAPTTLPTGRPARLLDPFCGTGVVLQEAMLRGYDVYGTDLSDKMIDYSRLNLDWLVQRYHLENTATVMAGDAMTATWQTPIDSVVAEAYLGQPFSAPPSPAKLADVRRNCNHIIGTFLQNIAAQLVPGTPLCLAVPAWRDTSGQLTHLPLTQNLESFGFVRHSFQHVMGSELVYFREDQVVARQLLVLTKAAP